MILQDLKNRHLKGENISFEITNHKRIPNCVKIGNSIIGDASISTIKAFNKWKETLITNSCSIEFKRNYSMQNGNKVTKKNWRNVVAISSNPCTNVHGVPAINQAIAKDGVYYEKWKLHYEVDILAKDSPKGFIFKEVNHGGGINGFHNTFKAAIWFAMKSYIRVYLEE